MSVAFDVRGKDEEASPSMSRTEDNLSNSDGPLIKKRDTNSRSLSMGVFSSSATHRDHWRQSCTEMNHCSRNDKQNHNCVWTLTIILAIIGFCNLLLSLIVIIVLRVSQGMEALEVIPAEDLVKFYGNTDLDRVCLQSGSCEGFGDEPIELLGDSGGIRIEVLNRLNGLSPSSFQILRNGTTASGIKFFNISDIGGSSIFSTDAPNFDLSNGVDEIKMQMTQTHRIIAPIDNGLSITSEKSISLHGAEGASIDSKNIVWTAKNDVFLRSSNGDIIIDARKGIEIPRIPVASTFLPGHSDVREQYKVCVCMPQGKLFTVPVRRGASRVNCAKFPQTSGHDPCI